MKEREITGIRLVDGGKETRGYPLLGNYRRPDSGAQRGLFTRQTIPK